MEALTAHIHGLEMRLLEPAVRASAAALADLLAPDFIEFGSSGHAYDRPAIIAALHTEQSAPAPQVERTISDFAVRRLADDVALATYRVARRAPEVPHEECFLRSSIWRRSNERWQMIFHQGTRVAGPRVVRAGPDNSPPRTEPQY
jgi:hypothetical protein